MGGLNNENLIAMKRSYLMIEILRMGGHGNLHPSVKDPVVSKILQVVSPLPLDLQRIDQTLHQFLGCELLQLEISMMKAIFLTIAEATIITMPIMRMDVVIPIIIIQ